MNVQLLEEVIGIIADHLSLSADDIAIDSDITGDLGADSLDIVELVAKFEDRFSMTATDDAIMQMLTVEDVVNFISEKLGEVQNSDIDSPIQLTF